MLATRLTQLQRTQRQKALACVNYISALPFGAIADSTGTPAMAVLKAGIGDCLTKSALLGDTLVTVCMSMAVRAGTTPAIREGADELVEPREVAGWRESGESQVERIAPLARSPCVGLDAERSMAQVHWNEPGSFVPN